MTKRKHFDCVAMKWEIQRKIQEKYAGMSEEEARRSQWRKIMNDPILGPYLTKVLSRTKTTVN